jgi:RNA polymerase sigma-70 factor, ECF subfamily
VFYANLMRHSHTLAGFDASGLRKARQAESGDKPQPLVEVRPLAEIEQEVLAAYDQFAANLFRYARALGKDTELARDAVQEAFLRYFLSLSEGEIIYHNKSWIFRVARNYVLDRLKEYAYRNCISLDTKEMASLPDPRQAREDHAWEEQLDQALSSLSPRELECLRLRAEGLKNKEIAEVLNLRLGTIGTLMARGLNKIRRACNLYR